MSFEQWLMKLLQLESLDEFDLSFEISTPYGNEEAAEILFQMLQDKENADQNK
jgi:hypothetical protein